METIILTGATGFLGSHFLFQALRSGNYRVICLGRDRTPQLLAERITSALEDAAVSYRQRERVNKWLTRCEWVCADLTKSDLGVGLETRAMIAALSPCAVWHFAASLQYEEEAKSQTEEINVNGTRRVLDLAQAVGVNRFFYISTAYVNGALTGDIGNTINETGVFNNNYEWSKQEAEKAVIASGLDYTIVRPSIVIGNSETYLSGGAKTGFYSFLRQLKRVSKIAERQNCRVRIKATRDTYLNLIPVDEFTRDCFTIAQVADRSNRIFNCTADQVCKLHEMVGLLEYVDLRNIDVEEVIDEPTPIETMVQRRTAFFSSYTNNRSLRFIRTLPGPAGVALEDLNHYAANGFTVRSSSLFAAAEHLDRPSGRLRYHYTATDGHSHAVLIINAYGLPLDFWEHIIESLTPNYDVYAPEFTRSGERNVPSEFDADVDDIVALANGIGKPIHMLSWCSGSSLAVVAATRIENLVSSAYIGGGYILAQREADLREVAAVTRRIYERVAQSEAAGRSIYDALFSNMKSNMRARSIDLSEDINLVLSTVNPAYFDWISALFDDFATFRSHATKLVHLWQRPVDASLSKMRGAKLFMIGKDDASVDPRVTLEVSKRVLNSECWIIDDADHFVLHNDSRVHDRLGRFLASCSKAYHSRKQNESGLVIS